MCSQGRALGMPLPAGPTGWRSFMLQAPGPTSEFGQRSTPEPGREPCPLSLPLRQSLLTNLITVPGGEGETCKECVKNYKLALADVAQWIEGKSANQRVTGSTPSQGTCLGGRPCPQSGHVRGKHRLMFLSLSFSFPSPLSKNK